MNDTSTPETGRDGSAGPFANLGQPPQMSAEPPPQASDVGTLLCATRMRIGKDLQDVAAVLHIRYNFLVAIEDGRYEDLPGQAYAIGFVRAYADHLGLDGDEVVRRYKEETAGIKRVTRYEYPIPPPESGIPSGAMLLIAVVLGMVVYGVWYTMADADRRAADVIQEVPDRLAALLRDDTASVPQSEPAQQMAEDVPPPPEADDQPAPETPSADAPTAEKPAAPAAVVAAAPPATPEAQAAAGTTPSVQTPAPQTPAPLTPSVQAASVQPPAAQTKAAIPQAVTPQAVTSQAVTPQGVTPPVAAPVTASAPPKPAAAPATTTTAPAAPKVAVGAPATTQTPPATASTQPAPTPTPPAQVSSTQTPASQAPAPKPEAAKTPVAAAKPAETKPATVQSTAVSAPVSSAPASSTPASSAPAQPSPSAATSKPAAPPATSATTVAAAAPPAPKAVKPATASAKNANVELRAKSDSWIQVRDGEQLLLTRFLRKGETYKVPDRTGLTLMTLNAGGVEVIVDGAIMPPLGDPGSVARGVSLDGDKLKAQAKPAPAAPAVPPPAND